MSNADRRHPLTLVPGYTRLGLPPEDTHLRLLVGETSMHREIEGWLRHLRGVGRTPATIHAYAHSLQTFAAHCLTQGVTEIGKVEGTHVAEWLAQFRDRGCAQNTVYRHNQALRAFFDWATSRGHAFVRHAAPLVRRDREQIARIPTREEIEALLATCEPSVPRFRDHRDRALILFLWSTGCRRSEASALNLEHVRFRRQPGQELRAEATVRGKGRKQRVVFIGPRAALALEQYLQHRRPDAGDWNTSAVWLTREGKRMTPERLTEAIGRRVKDAGIEWPLTAHKLRHAFATSMLEAGCDLFALMKMLGHSDLGTTQIYLHMAPERARQLHGQCDPTVARASIIG